jgi:hypothetical protein
MAVVLRLAGHVVEAAAHGRDALETIAQAVVARVEGRE